MKTEIEYKKYYDLLRLFAYETYLDYVGMLLNLFI